MQGPSGASSTPDGEVSAFCTICCVLPFVLGIVGAAVAYYVFGIIFLVDDRYVCSDMSPLWVYSLVAILSPCLYPLTLMLASELRQFIGMSDAQRYLIVTAFSNGFVFVYGTVIIFSEGYVCSNMKNAGLYTWAQVALYLNLISMLVLICTLYMVSVNKDAEHFIGNHLSRNAGNQHTHENEPSVDDTPQEAVPIPEPVHQARQPHEKDPLLRPSAPAPAPASSAQAAPGPPPALAELD